MPQNLKKTTFINKSRNIWPCKLFLCDKSFEFYEYGYFLFLTFYSFRSSSKLGYVRFVNGVGLLYVGCEGEDSVVEGEEQAYNSTEGASQQWGVRGRTQW